MDNLSGYFVKQFGNTLAPYLVKLFNKIVKTGNIPLTWKIAKITPVHKKGPIDKVENYRPISNINSIAKVFEICLLQRLERLDPDVVLGRYQHGFRKNHGIETAIAEVTEFVAEARDQKKKVAIYSADLTAAFDLLRKEKLVEVMLEKNIPMYLINTIHSYLEERMGYVQIEEARSCVEEIRAGCVQGSILGPLLFNLYMNKLEDIISPLKLVGYADDSYILASNDDIDALENELANKMIEHFNWLKNMGMKCNMGKTELLVFDNHSLKINIDNNTEIKSKDSMKVLGVEIDSSMSWEPYITKTIRKVRSCIFALRYLKKTFR